MRDFFAEEGWGAIMLCLLFVLPSSRVSGLDCKGAVTTATTKAEVVLAEPA